MKAIEGVSLASLIQRADDDYVQLRTEEALKQIRGMQNSRRSYLFQIEAKQKEIEKMQKKVTEIDERLERALKGDWNAIPDPQQEKKADNEPAAK